MVTRMSDDNVRKGIEETLGNMERSVVVCGEDFIDHAINIGRHFSSLEPRNLDKLFSLTGKFHR